MPRSLLVILVILVREPWPHIACRDESVRGQLGQIAVALSALAMCGPQAYQILLKAEG